MISPVTSLTLHKSHVAPARRNAAVAFRATEVSIHARMWRATERNCLKAGFQIRKMFSHQARRLPLTETAVIPAAALLTGTVAILAAAFPVPRQAPVPPSGPSSVLVLILLVRLDIPVWTKPAMRSRNWPVRLALIFPNLIVKFPNSPSPPIGGRRTCARQVEPSRHVSIHART